jgi:ribosomal protein S18 acetylase RimI-like enzyme
MATAADPPGVAGLGLEHWREASRALAAAFYDDPVFSWLIPSDRRRLQALERFFGIETRHLVLAHGRSMSARTAAGTLAGVTLVLPGEHWRTPIKVQAAQGPQAMRVFAHRLPVALGVLAKMESHHPREPHVYLPYIGTIPACQGQGVGTAMLAPVLDSCDEAGLPAYLEASSPRSAELYRRLGFETAEVIRPLGSPPIELMRRPAT